MKKTTLLLFAFLVFASTDLVFAQKGKELYSITSDKIDISFTTAYTFNDLVKVKAELEKMNIQLTYQNLVFAKNGKLKQITAAIKYPDGEGSSFASRELQEGDNPGFRKTFR